jgi:hypothetical protein
MIGLCLAVLATWFSGFSVAASEGFGDLLAFDRIGGVLRAPKSCFEKDARERGKELIIMDWKGTARGNGLE